MKNCEGDYVLGVICIFLTKSFSLMTDYITVIDYTILSGFYFQTVCTFSTFCSGNKS